MGNYRQFYPLSPSVSLLRSMVLRGHAVGWPDSGRFLTDGSIQYGCNSRTDQRARSLTDVEGLRKPVAGVF